MMRCATRLVAAGLIGGTLGFLAVTQACAKIDVVASIPDLGSIASAVGGEHVGGVDRSGGLGTLDIGDARSQSNRGAVRVAVPRDPRQTGGERVDERRRRRLGRLVGVEADPDVDLR